MGKLTLNYGRYVQTNQTTFIPLKLTPFFLNATCTKFHSKILKEKRKKIEMNHWFPT
jgi:hypothetical protein